MAEVIIYSTNNCPYCVNAKRLLDKKGVNYQEINIEQDQAQREIMIQKAQRQTVPQIFINDKHIGGCDDLYALERSGALDELLNA